MSEWKEYVINVLGGIEERVRRGRGREKNSAVTEEEISREEVRALRKQKVGKASGIDENPMEAWKYGGEELKK